MWEFAGDHPVAIFFLAVIVVGGIVEIVRAITMSSNKRQLANSEETVENDRSVSVAPNNEEDKGRSGKREFSWYGGKVDEDIVREIVRLKREHKL